MQGHTSEECADGNPDLYTYVYAYLEFINNILAKTPKSNIPPIINVKKEDNECEKSRNLLKKIKDLLKDIV